MQVKNEILASGVDSVIVPINTVCHVNILYKVLVEVQSDVISNRELAQLHGCEQFAADVPHTSVPAAGTAGSSRVGDGAVFIAWTWVADGGSDSTVFLHSGTTSTTPSASRPPSSPPSTPPPPASRCALVFSAALPPPPKAPSTLMRLPACRVVGSGLHDP